MTERPITPNTDPAQLQEFKNRIPPITEIIVKTDTWEAAHGILGSRHRKEIKSHLTERQMQLNTNIYHDRLLFLSDCRDFMLARAYRLKESDPQISMLINRYFSCLSSWSQGADITPDEALFLQDEFFGCQTLMFRNTNGDVVIGHTEEHSQPETIPNVNEITTFDVAGIAFTSYTAYDYCLPGSTISMLPYGFMAVDSLHIRPSDTPGFLSNAVSWILLMGSVTTQTPEMINKLQPTIDGYIINQVFRTDNQVVGQVIEFAHQDLSVNYLGGNPGDYQYRTNILSPDTPVKQYEFVKPADANLYTDSINTGRYILDRINNWLSSGGTLTDPLMTTLKILGFPGHDKLYEIRNTYTWASVSGTVSSRTEEIKMLVESGPVIISQLHPVEISFSPTTNS